jgi:hypothetical protein
MRDFSSHFFKKPYGNDTNADFTGAKYLKIVSSNLLKKGVKGVIYRLWYRYQRR